MRGVFVGSFVDARTEPESEMSRVVSKSPDDSPGVLSPGEDTSAKEPELTSASDVGARSLRSLSISRADW